MSINRHEVNPTSDVDLGHIDAGTYNRFRSVEWSNMSKLLFNEYHPNSWENVVAHSQLKRIIGLHTKRGSDMDADRACKLARMALARGRQRSWWANHNCRKLAG